MTRSGRWLSCLPIGLSLVAPSAAGQEQASDAVRRLAIGESIIAREESASDRPFDPSFRAKALERLAALPMDALLQAQAQEDVGLGLNALGDSQADLVYTPVTPCRIFDSRLAGGPLAPGLPRSIKVTGDTTFQGGANCGIPFGPATSAMINFVAVSPAGKGNMQITPFGQAMPLASFINYSNAAGTNLANGLAVALCNPSEATCTNDVTIQANNSGVDLVADVQGYFASVTTGGIGSALLADGAVTAAKVATGAVVKSLNGQTDAVTLSGTNGLGVAAGSGTVTLSADPTVLQRRVTGSCPPGESIRVVLADGNVACEPDDLGPGDIAGITTNAGSGLDGGCSAGTCTLSADPTDFNSVPQTSTVGGGIAPPDSGWISTFSDTITAPGVAGRVVAIGSMEFRCSNTSSTNTACALLAGLNPSVAAPANPSRSFYTNGVGLHYATTTVFNVFPVSANTTTTVNLMVSNEQPGDTWFIYNPRILLFFVAD